ncbi:MAG: 2, 3-cyclic nucleotide 2-phosphodiesterase [Moraxellaceae bacterium]|jgi:tRNA nucleotidyltransferase (CCA-adding enzyme)|nr:2, 3-cyclic nucleotide 2-phosphodiesterase [Moraxellaceae bacterium]
MKIYLVGGAVRDRLLDRPVQERDWVVVGARPDDLLAQGFRAVGRDFPVFLHPVSGEEYALARTERKSGSGHTGFICDFSPDITLEEDLVRRDLTINAMAQDADGSIIDPHGGRRDLDLRLLRHVSDAFREDPLRVFRVARFAARYAPLGFTVATETMALMREMSASGELGHLTPERVWKETERALGEDRPDIYVQVLHDCGALACWMPEVDRLFGVPQRADYHPEIDTGVHILMTLRITATLSPEARVRFAALVHDLGKGVTPEEELPRHINHEARGVPLVRELCQRLKAPRAFEELGVLASRYHLDVHRAGDMRPSTLLKKLMEMDALRRPERFAEMLLCCEADARGRLGLDERPYPQREYWQCAQATLRAVSPKALQEQGLEGDAFVKALEQAREAALHDFREEWRKSHADR